MPSHLLPTRLAVAAALTCGAFGGAAHAFDARAVALGGSVIAAGEGVPGALANPAALMDMKRADQRTHFSFGLGVGIRDEAGLADIVDDETDLAGDIADEIDLIDASDIECEPEPVFDGDGTVPVGFDFDREDICLDDLGGLSALSTRALDVFDSVDGEDVTAQAGGAIGVGFTAFAVPFALHLETRVTGRGRLDVSDNDRAYVQSFRDLLADEELRFGEIADSVEFELDPPPPYDAGYDSTDLPDLDVQVPEERLDSEGSGGGMLRVSLGASFATTLALSGHEIDVGVTPKLSSLLAQGIESSADEFFEDDREPFTDRFEDSEVTDVSFTFDIGAGVTLERFPLRLAGVLRNVLPESIETEEGIEFDTTPQLLVGGAYDFARISLNADLALNEAEVDGLETRPLAFGVEFEHGPLALRGGLSHDTARGEAATALSLGLGLGPFDIGGRLAALENVQVGAGLSFSF